MASLRPMKAVAWRASWGRCPVRCRSLLQCSRSTMSLPRYGSSRSGCVTSVNAVELPKLVENNDRQQSDFMIGSSSTQTFGDDGVGDHGWGAMPIMAAVSDDIIRATLGFLEPNILEENTEKLVKLLARHDYNHEEGFLPPPPPPLDNVIFVAAPDREDGVELVQQVLGSPAMAVAFNKVVWLRLDFGFLFATISYYQYVLQKSGLWAILCFLLGELGLDEAQNYIEIDKWDEVKIAEEISKKKGLKGATSLFVIEGRVNAGLLWDLIQEALVTFGCARGSAVVVIVTDMAVAGELHRQRGVIGDRPLLVHSLVEYWSTRALAVLDRNRLKTDYLQRNMWTILRQIQDSCEPQAFCIKMFVHYLCANPRISKEKLDELFRKLVFTGCLPPDSSDAIEIREANGKMLLKFCYDDLPRSYRICLLYLAIFPPGKTIWRSRLVLWWIVEGLITGRDMRRALLEAERCFNTLVSRWFVCPADISADRKVRSCTVHSKLIQEFITEGARQEQLLHPRLSRHLAQHFSAQDDLQLRPSDTIQDFMLNLGKKSCGSNRSIGYHIRLNLIIVLDLEDCKHLKNPVSRKHKKNMNLCLKNICNNMLLLKYLSIRNTDVDELPKKISNLQQLEILDIRQTNVPSDGTKDIVLPKLKCLLAGHTQTTTTGMSEKPVPSVQIPSKINTMPNMEVLSHVNASHDADVLKHIGHLWQLRKLGAVIDGNLKDWLKAIGDLNECLRSLSIHVKSEDLSNDAQFAEEHNVNQDTSIHLELLERLSISGSASRRLLPLFFRDGHHKLISKVTLRDTLLDHCTLEAHLKMLWSLQRIKLRHNSYIQRELTFNPHVLPKLKFLIIECDEITSINFLANAAPKLEKIVWSFTKMESLSGITNLPVLQELVLKGDESTVLDQVIKDIADHPNSPTLLYSIHHGIEY